MRPPSPGHHLSRRSPVADNQIRDSRPFRLRRRRRFFAVQHMNFLFQLSGQCGQKPVGFQPCNTSPASVRRFVGWRFNCGLFAELNAGVCSFCRDFSFFQRRRLRNTRRHFKSPAVLPESREAFARNFPHAHHDGVRAKLFMNFCQRGIRIFGDDGDELHLLFRTWNDCGILNLDSRRNFRIGQHREIAKCRFKKTAEGQPQLRRAQDDRLLSGRQHLLHEF